MNEIYQIAELISREMLEKCMLTPEQIEEFKIGAREVIMQDELTRQNVQCYLKGCKMLYIGVL